MCAACESRFFTTKQILLLNVIVFVSVVIFSNISCFPISDFHVSEREYRVETPYRECFFDMLCTSIYMEFVVSESIIHKKVNSNKLFQLSCSSKKKDNLSHWFIKNAFKEQRLINASETKRLFFL